MVIEKGMSAYEAARERTLEENKRKMEELNLRHLSAAVSEALKIPSHMKQKRRRIIDAPRRRSRRLANLPVVKYVQVVPDKERMKRFPRKLYASINLASRGSISMEARLEAARKAEELESQLDPEYPSLVKPILHSHVAHGFRVSLGVSVRPICQSMIPLSFWWMRRTKSLRPITLPTGMCCVEAGLLLLCIMDCWMEMRQFFN